MLIFQCIIGLQSQSIDFTNTFAQVGISSGDPLFIELPRDLKSYWGQDDVVLKPSKILYGQSEDARIWYENLRNYFLERVFVTSKLDPCLSMSKTVICVVCVDDCIFWEHSQYEIDNAMISFEDYGPSYNWG